MDEDVYGAGWFAMTMGILSLIVAVKTHLPVIVFVVLGVFVAYGALMVARGLGWTER